MKKLGVNTAGGVLDIIGAVLYFIALFVILGSAVTEAVTTNTLATVFLVYAAVCVLIHIIGLVQSRKVGIKLVGNILGIIGHAVYLFFGAILGWVAMILVIISSLFTLKDNKY